MTDKATGPDGQSPPDPQQTRVFPETEEPAPWWQTAPTTQQPSYPPPEAPPGYQVPGPGGQWPGYPQQVPQQPYYPAQQPFPGYPPPPRSNQAGLIVGIVLAVVALVGAGIAAVALGGSDSSSNQVAATTTVTQTTPAVVAQPGFKTIEVPALGIAYEVPSGWSAGAGPSSHGGLTAYGQAGEGAKYCPGSAYRTLSFVVRSELSDLTAAAQRVAEIAAETGYSNSNSGDRNYTQPNSRTTRAGLAARFVLGTGPWQPSAPGCTTDGYAVYSLAFEGPKGETLVLAIESDRNTTGQMTLDEVGIILDSVRAK
ncbi:hypothetical protein [Nocardia sp. XZ_19_385]|uniref:hypothetical protein n=1 Tax=Nocardia sp. XZ_19_385 TaxID=2769488 RepID=UPI00188EEAA8|nr:hypothetical protein [Nocardia sp. XZ_19_385]